MVVAKPLDFHQKVFQLFPVANKYLGEVGLELEVEGTNLPHKITSYWNCHEENSLRGEHEEYVLKKPASRKAYPAYLQYLMRQFVKHQSEFDMSPLTSVHVHINMNTSTLIEVYNLVVCYLIVEDLLCQHAGEYRVGNVFCLRAHDAEFFIDWLAKAAKQRKFSPNLEELRYSGINICSVPKFNSVEFRALRGTVDAQVIREWTQMLLSLKDAAKSYDNPREIIVDFSRLGSECFLKKLLPDHADLLKRVFPKWEKRLWESVRLVQEIAYATDWKQEEKKDKRLFRVGDEPEPEPAFDIDEEG